MNEEEVIQFVTEMPGVVCVTATEERGAPQAAWGDSFFFFDPAGDEPADRRMPFATLVTQDYAGFDEESNLNRPGVFRLNIAVGREEYERLLGHPPADHAAHRLAFDYSAIDRLMPHPVYAAQAWVSIINPGERTMEQAKTLLAGAQNLASSRRQRRLDFS